MTPVRIAILGFGNVGQSLVEYLNQNNSEVTVCAIADSSTGIVLNDLVDLQLVLRQKRSGRKLSELENVGERIEVRDLIRHLPSFDIPIIVECLPTNVIDGQPALELLAESLAQGTHVVTVDKGPLVHGFELLSHAAQQSGATFGFTGTTGVPIPAELAGQRVIDIRGILNGTTNYILTQMQEHELGFADALARAQAERIAEPDPSQDIEGWDTACKILILAKSLLGSDAKLDDVRRIGIGAHTEDLLNEARLSGRALRLIGRARVWQGRVRLSVAPKLVEPDSPFHSIVGTSKAAVFRTASGDVIISRARSGPNAIARAILDDIERISQLM